jgi:hypothetical protein
MYSMLLIVVMMLRMCMCEKETRILVDGPHWEIARASYDIISVIPNVKS